MSNYKYTNALTYRALIILGLFFIIAIASNNHWLDRPKPIRYATNNQFKPYNSRLIIYHQSKQLYQYQGNQLQIIQGLHAHPNITYHYRNMIIKNKNNPVIIFTNQVYNGNNKLIVEDRDHNIIKTFNGYAITQKHAIINKSAMFKINHGYVFIDQADYILIKNNSK